MWKDVNEYRLIQMTNRDIQLVSYLNDIGCNYKKDYLIKYSTYFKRGGVVSVYITPTNTDDLEKVIIYLIRNKIDYRLIGNTSNVIFLDTLKYSVVMSTKFINSIDVKGDVINCSAGVMMEELVRVAILNKAIGYEGLEGIPGTIGGGIVMNAGSYGSTISDYLLDVRAVNKDGDVIQLNSDDCKFSRRDSIFKQDTSLKILSARFKVVSDGFKLSEVANAAEIYHIARHSYQEYVLPNLGSMFTLKSCVYKKTLNRGLIRRLEFFFTRLLFTNKLAKFIRRKKPTNRHLNNLIIKHENIKYPMSHKSVNILLNDGQVTDNDIIAHIIKMKSLVEEAGELENEIVTNCIVDLPVELKNKFELLC